MNIRLVFFNRNDRNDKSSKRAEQATRVKTPGSSDARKPATRAKTSDTERPPTGKQQSSKSLRQSTESAKSQKPIEKTIKISTDKSTNELADKCANPAKFAKKQDIKLNLQTGGEEKNSVEKTKLVSRKEAVTPRPSSRSSRGATPRHTPRSARPSSRQSARPSSRRTFS